MNEEVLVAGEVNALFMDGPAAGAIDVIPRGGSVETMGETYKYVLSSIGGTQYHTAYVATPDGSVGWPDSEYAREMLGSLTEGQRTVFRADE